ncbi:hypothetical protein K431DRAFT_286705 [Polychaeton citri CBS 116435]|uniref:DUF676 domain-containing protein n=1 Tax=Polychaeton citri CBS 116435 TaxID=1314669 RepID=A0A9P4UMB7_9PEZI|nr:hypothetical protein K431DRAFT_286705 [Polychaeton citri CBS 116435]
MDSKRPLNNRGAPPPLPSRGVSSSSLSLAPSSSSMTDAPPPSYEDSVAAQIWSASKAGQQLGAGDPRSSSTQSLVPSENAEQRHENDDHRRKLLMVYIHGFMGNETSFRSFPAHVHNLLAVLLAESHVVHTKIYPRYRSKRNITFARDDFSRWIEPHVDDEVDVVLLGHSMGGLLCGEIVLMPAEGEGYAGGRGVFKHRILGSINFDVPFLGMHPGIVKSGLASLFAPGGEESKPGDKYTYDDIGSVSDSGPATPGAGLQHYPTGISETLWTPGQPDPNFNPTFQNDVVLPVRKGWQSAWHFLSKHATSASDLGKATKKLVTSHLEFGGAMANYSELKLRYVRLRALEEESEDIRRSVAQNTAAFGVPSRVRFVNYYTACTGREKKTPEEVKEDEIPEEQAGLGAREGRTSLDVGGATAGSSVRSASPRISLEEYGEDGIVQKEILEPMQEMAPTPIDESQFEDWEDAAESITVGEPESQGDEGSHDTASLDATSPHTSTIAQIPEMPTKPPPLDVSFIKDETTRKLVEKEYSRATKAYEKAVRDREKAIQDSAKAQEKQSHKAKKDAEKASKDAEKARLKLEKEKAKAERKAKKQKPENEMSHAEKEERRMKQEKLRMENEGRRMRGEPQLSVLPEDEEPATPSTEEDASEQVSEELAQRSSRPSTVATASYRTETASSLVRSPSPSIVPSQSQTASSSRSRRPSTTTTASRSTRKAGESKKPKKERKFCTLPPKDSNGERDPCWIRVFMENVDEVGAHCGLFFVDERYERLVGDVAGRIEGWVNEESGRRVAQGEASPLQGCRGDVKR